MGFTTDRVLEAADPDHAGEAALAMLSEEEPSLQDSLNGPDDPFPVILVESVEEIDSGRSQPGDNVE